ncbi:glucosidase [Nakamurella flava]|uniref:Glucosidase n=1 Tax=Nakamurella flava TaxID=2576308 RepID=A0A4U6QJD6_9ACTN|nr:glucosidase [Nakamurella flava]TKV60533.1 glucosidase [Nakamurella flava]
MTQPPPASAAASSPRTGAEQDRIDAADRPLSPGAAAPEAPPWRDWGPYLSERAWGTVREDYSADGDAWAFFPHDHARSRVYRWNEDGMAGFCDETQNWCLALSLWNGVDPILKERMFGLTGPQGNHGEDVKEYWWYLDSTPTHSWNTWRYHYSQHPYPYQQLLDVNAARSRTEPEYELVDTGVFDDGRYWVVTVDYAKADARDLLMRITVENAGPDEATLHVLPTLWFRNTWSWEYTDHPPAAMHAVGDRIVGDHSRSGPLMLTGGPGPDGAPPEPLFCENETNTERLFGSPNAVAYPKDGINDHVVSGAATVNPERTGTKAALHYTVTVPPGGSTVLRVRLVGVPHPALDADEEALLAEPVDVGAGSEFDAVMTRRQAEADEFYAQVIPAHCTPDETAVARQAFAGLLWGKQFYHYDVRRWLEGDPGQPPPPPGRGAIRNGTWRHLNNHEVLLMPDPWEYPWYAAWDLAFHCVTMAHIDPWFAKGQLVLLLREWYLHPNGQLPAYEWNFSDVNPPVHAWAAIRVFEIDAALTGEHDFTFLARVFHKLLINFTWWVDSKDRNADNLFQGGFMGLDNIAPLDRSSLPPEVGYLEQADSTAWMAMYALDLLDMALRLARHDIAYEDVATKFFEHFLMIASAANLSGLWDEQDGYYYDVLHLADGRDVPLKVKSLVGLVPIRAVLSYDVRVDVTALPDFAARAKWFLANHPEYGDLFHTHDIGDVRHRLLSLVPPDRLLRLLEHVFDEQGLLSDHGIRGISAWHREHPFSVEVNGVRASVDYEPAESTNNLFGGNSNWRGPIWFPLNVLLIEAIRDYDRLAPGDLTVEYPTGSRRRCTVADASDDIAHRLVSIFLPAPDGRRPVFGGYDLLATDPRWRDNLPFHEYFHGDTGEGLGAEHQTGWTALVAHLLLTTPAREDPSVD